MFTELSKSFENKFLNKYNGLFKQEPAFYQEYFGCLSVGYGLERRMSILQVKELFEKDEDLRFLYYAVPSKHNGFGRRLSFYSKPRKNSMFVLWGQSEDGGLLTEIGVNIYASIDDMLVDTQKDLNDILQGSFDDRSTTTHRNLLIDFLL